MGAKVRLVFFGALIGSAAAGAALWGWQAHLIFEPERALQAAPADFPFAVTEVAIALAARQNVHGWWIPSAKRGAKAVLYLHGNDGNVSTSVREVEPLRELGYSVFLIDYRGYGASEGPFPTEKAVYEDAEAGWNYLIGQGLDPADLYIYGHSLGGAIAIELALRHPEAAGLLVESSFTSISDMARLEKKYSLLPVRWLLSERFDSIDKVSRLSLPVLYLHGTADEIVPFSMGNDLYRASGGRKQFVAIDSGRHDDNAAAGGAVMRAAISGFIEAAALRRATRLLAAHSFE
jgi:pimeloyl-ACP methyl ester carboxylesterase